MINSLVVVEKVAPMCKASSTPLKQKKSLEARGQIGVRHRTIASEPVLACRPETIVFSLPHHPPTLFPELEAVGWCSQLVGDRSSGSGGAAVIVSRR